MLEDAVGECGLGFCYQYGMGVEVNEIVAVSWFEKSAKRGNPTAQWQLAQIYYNGTESIVANKKKGINYLQQAADNGQLMAIACLAYEYASGENLEKDLAKSLELFIKAADNGNVYAQAMVGIIYFEGDELVNNKKDYELAVKYLYSAAQYMKDDEYVTDETRGRVLRYLGICYRYGRGVEANQSLASYYTEEAAKYGEEGSKRALNLLRRN
jgi:TPR repeat protein